MPEKRKRGPTVHPRLETSDIERLLTLALEEPGVAEAVELYERAESVYQRLSTMADAPAGATNSTTDYPLVRG